MRTVRKSRVAAVMLLVSWLSVAARADEPPSVETILARFQSTEGTWQSRIKALAQLARSGKDAGAKLEAALQSSSRTKRQFAMYALALLQDKGTSGAVINALEDKDPIVRTYAMRAFGMLGGLKIEAAKRKPVVTSFGSSNRRYATKVFSTKERPPEWKSTRSILADYKLSSIDSVRKGKKAPDFKLYSARGKSIRLSQYRNKKAVVLEFNSASW